MAVHFSFQSYSWSLGTTSFRMADFHRKVEEQLMIIDDFWNIEDNKNCSWESNPQIQTQYYDFAFERGFITGELEATDTSSKSKTARQKTSGLVDIGLIDNNRRLSEVGEKLLNIARSSNFASDNEFQIPSDSFIYFKQILKTSYEIQDGYVRPLLVVGRVLQECDGYLTDNEFTYLLPLCVDESTTRSIVSNIKKLRNGEVTIDSVICDIVLNRYNYPQAMDYLIQSDKSPEDIMIVGMNRKSPRYDASYASLYGALIQTYLKKDYDAASALLKATKKIKHRPGTLWRNLLFENPRSVKGKEDLKANGFDSVSNEENMARRFFMYMHLFKIKSNLLDYKDLNRRYLNITDAFIFENGIMKFTPLFENFFKTEANEIFKDAFSSCDLLEKDCDITQIHPSLILDSKKLLKVFNKEQNTNFDSMEQVYDYFETERYNRFRKLIDTKFPNNTIIQVLVDCETRSNDDELITMFGGEADVPTIFEYVVAVAWYRLSKYHGKILQYMNLSLDNNLLPRTHAGGGESDIVYKYLKTDKYPAHTLLIECTLMTGTTQRHGEMEPVSRHLSNYMIDEDKNAYCTFVANNLHPTVISDFRGRKNMPYYRNDTDYVESMKIIPLHTEQLRSLLEKNIYYEQIYELFEGAFLNEEIKAPPEWYTTCIKGEIEKL